MFGHIQANLEDLNEEEKHRYKAAYCGLCNILGQRHGFHSRFCLTYDFTFLILLLSSLYEPDEKYSEGRCLASPLKKQDYMDNIFSEYAADMTIALAYYKCLDDWNDEHKITGKGYASILAPDYKKVQEKWPDKCRKIEDCLAELNILEQQENPNPDETAKCFGVLMGEIFAWKEDRWTPYLKRLGFDLGRYIYMADAAIDFQEDIEKGNYNPIEGLVSAPEEMRPILTVILGGAAESFEYLPLVQDVQLLRNIMYSGIWMKYNRRMHKEGENEE